MQNPICDSCCCFSLKTGGLIIGWINLVIASLGLIISMIAIGTQFSSDSYSEYVDMYGLFGFEYVDKTTFLIIVLVFALLCLIQLISSLYLILGITHDQHKKMIMFMVLFFIGIIIQFFGLFDQANSTREVFKDLLGITVQIYYFCVIYSLYTVIKNRNVQTEMQNLQECV